MKLKKIHLNVIKPLDKRVSVPLGFTAVASAANAGIHKKNTRFQNNSTNNIE